MNPADDYVREFTQDVPWEHILRASNIAETSDTAPDRLDRVAGDVTVETNFLELAPVSSGVAVESVDGTVIGVVTARRLASALATGNGAPATAPEG